MSRRWLALLLLLSHQSGSNAGELSVRVEAAAGVPRIVVNGKPVRARVFWGAPGVSRIEAGTSWKEAAFEFVSSGDAANGTMHFRFGTEPGEVWLDDIQVVDPQAPDQPLVRSDFEGGQADFERDWTFWPTGAANTVGAIGVVPPGAAGETAALHVRLSAPGDGRWPDFHIYHQPRLKLVKGQRYRVAFRVRTEPARDLTVAFYRPGTSYVLLGAPPDHFEPQIRLAAGAGVDIVSFPIPMPWPAPGEAADWSDVDAICRRVLSANPRALLLPRFGMDPPAWWREAHPDDVMQWEDGRRGAMVVASELYRRDAARRLEALVEHLEAAFGDQVAGYHPCGQNTGEWFYHDTWGPTLNGYAPADLAAWRQWLRERYHDDAQLQRSWNDPAASLDTAAVPPAADRHAAPSGLLRDPARERPLIDWAEFQQQAMAECVLDLARAARTASRGRKLVVFFYGYLFEFGAIGNGASTSGHYALRRVLDSPDIDVLCSPISYNDRGLGQSAPAMSPAESVALAGKLWLNEDDTHTFLARERIPGSMDHVTTLEESNEELERNVAQAALRNFGTWWMDLGASGWFDDPGLWSVMKQLRAVDEELLASPTPFRPQVAAVVDERSMFRVAAGGDRVTKPAVYDARIALGRMGTPYGQYLLEDVLAGRVESRLYVFLNAWVLDADQRARLLAAIPGKARVWCYAPGYQEGGQVSLVAMRDLTGFELRLVSPARGIATPTEAGRRLGLLREFGTEAAPRPLFAAADASGDEVLATYPDGTAAVALRRTPSGPSFFVGPPGLTSELLRAAAVASGVHLFTKRDCNVYANGPYVAVHAAEDGAHQIDLGREGPVRDALDGTDVAAGPVVTLDLRKGQTRVLRAGPPATGAASDRP